MSSFKRYFCVFFLSLIAILSFSFPGRAEELLISLGCDENGKYIYSDNTSSVEEIFSESEAGKKIVLRFTVRNDYENEKTDEVGFYLKATTEDYDPEEKLYSYFDWNLELAKLMQESMEINEEEEAERYDEIIAREIYLSGRIHRDTFGKDELTAEEKLFFEALDKIKIVKQDQGEGKNGTEEVAGFKEDGLYCLSLLQKKEQSDFELTLELADDLTDDELLVIRNFRLKIVMKKLGTNPKIDIEFTTMNPPKNGEFYVPTKFDENGFIVPDEDNYASYEIRIYNTGNVPLTFYQIDVEHNTYFTGEKLNCGANRYVQGNTWFSEEDAAAGGKNLILYFEAVLDHPGMKEHLKQESSIWLPVSYPEELTTEKTEEFSSEATIREEFSSDVTFSEEKSQKSENLHFPLWEGKAWIIPAAGVVILLIGAGLIIRFWRKRR